MTSRSRERPDAARRLEPDAVNLRQRSDGVIELRVNGVFVMDDVESSSERVLARHVLEAGARDVLVGGLGLGFTAAELLDGGAATVVVAELHEEVVAAVDSGLGAGPLDDDRLEIIVGDVRDVLMAQPREGLDAICLDVDNGPDHLVHTHNALLYETDFLREAAARLRPGGQLVVWSHADSPTLRRRMIQVFDKTTSVQVPVEHRDQPYSYWLVCGRRGPTSPSRPSARAR